MIIYNECNIQNLTSFHLQNIANYVFEVINSYEVYILKYLFDFFKIDYHILAKGSKVIFAKEIITKPIILISEKYEELYYLDDHILVSSGYDIKKLILRLSNNNLGGFHYLYPLPASIGGMTFMNASDNKVSISSFIKNVIVLDENNNIKILSNKECNFDYRYSIFKEKKYIILYVLLNVKHIKKDIILDEIKESITYRINKQEINNTFGSIFKNGDNYKAYELINNIRDLLPKSESIYLSTKHANFLVNNNAKPIEVINYINIIKHLVFQNFGINLEEEVNIFY